MTHVFAKSAAIFAFAALGAAAHAGPIATGNAAGGALPIVTPTPQVQATEPAAPVILPQAETPAAAPAPAPQPAPSSGFIAGYMASFQ
ncbi:MAG: hypothetical protein AAF914_11280 [Pseudomonadota bacterium]